MDIVAGILLVLGSSFILLAAIGVGSGSAIMIGTSAAVVTAILVVLLQLIAGPVGAHILGRSVYQRLRPELDGPDELGDALQAQEDGG